MSFVYKPRSNVKLFFLWEERHHMYVRGILSSIGTFFNNNDISKFFALINSSNFIL